MSIRTAPGRIPVRSARYGSALHRVEWGDRRTVIQAWLASRGLIALVALLLAVTQQRSVLAMVNNWDAVHFGNLASGGYEAEHGGLLMAFFPGFPVVLRAGLYAGLPTPVTGVIVSVVCSAIAAAAMIRLGGPWAAVAWLFAPTAVFTAAPYTESMFCAAAFWAWERARSDRWLSAALLAAVACSVRVSGLFLVGALFVMIITTRRLDLATRARRTALLLVPAAVIGAYVLYLHHLTGSWNAWYTAQSTGWVRGFTPPWRSFLHTIPAITPGAFPDHPGWAWVFRGEVVSMALGLVVTAWCLARRMWAEAAYVGVQVLAFSLSYWFFSVNRALLLWFPLWIMIARWGTWQPRGEGRRRVHRVAVAITWVVGLGLVLAWSWLFLTGHWAS